MPTHRPAGPALLLSLTAAMTASVMTQRPAAATPAPAIGFTPNAYGVHDTAADAPAKDPKASSVLGFEFTANSSAFVTSLGYFNDPSFDPNTPFDTVALSPEPSGTYAYTQSHDVGLYQILAGNTSLELASATITTASTPNGDFLYEAITPVALVMGGDYVLAGVTGPNDPYLFNIEDDTQAGAVGLTQNGITYVEDRFDPGTVLALPTQSDDEDKTVPSSTPGFFGPNLLLGAPPVPEASTPVSLGLMLMLGLGGIVAAKRKKAL